MDFPSGISDEEPACQCRRHKRQVRSLPREDLLEEGMTTHSNNIQLLHLEKTEKFLYAKTI